MEGFILTVESVNYNTGQIIGKIHPQVPGFNPSDPPNYNLGSINDQVFTFEFIADRNLNFGSFGNKENDFEGDPDTPNYGIRKITGINIIDGMLFWTDNFSEPKKNKY